MRVNSYYLNVKDPLIIPLIIFLSCHEKVHDNKEFRHENSKPLHESRITKVEPSFDFKAFIP